MKDGRLRELLVTAPLPDDLQARRRSWSVVRAAFEEREPVRRRPNLRPALVLAMVAALVAAAVSSPGGAVIERVREAIGIERAQPALFSLPAPGRVLVSSTRGVWVVQPDGSKRLLGRYRESSWSPSGLFVVVARGNELVALDPRGSLRWTLARRAVGLPRWAGSAGDTRVAYFSGRELRVVAGDSDPDWRVAKEARRVPPAWRPGRAHVLAYVTSGGRIVARDVDARRTLWRTRSVEASRRLLWSDDGARLVAVKRRGLSVYRRDGRLLRGQPVPGVLGAAALAPGTHRLAVVRRLGDGSEVLLFDVDRPGRRPQRLFSGTGALTDLAWSPDGRWLLIGWQTADQWVFVRVGEPRRIEAVSNVSAQFRSSDFPTIAGWCCAP
jgi:hypothetical protein